MTRIAFAAGDRFAVPSLRALADESGCEVALVISPPDRAAGRGLSTNPGPVPAAARDLGLPLTQPVGDEDLLADLRNTSPDFLVTCAYGRKLSPAALAVARRASINIHASLLPRWRGAAPIERALLAGDADTGITTMIMAERIDAGEMLLQRSIPITATSTAGTLREELSAIGSDLIRDTLNRFDEIAPQEQDPALATRAPRIDKAEAELPWGDDAPSVDRRIRAFNPRPGSYTHLAGERTKIFASRVKTSEGAAGEVLELTRDGPLIACGTGSLLITELQRPGSGRMSGRDWLNGLRGRISVGDIAGCGRDRRGN